MLLRTITKYQNTAFSVGANTSSFLMKLPHPSLPSHPGIYWGSARASSPHDRHAWSSTPHMPPHSPPYTHVSPSNTRGDRDFQDESYNPAVGHEIYLEGQWPAIFFK